MFISYTQCFVLLVHIEHSSVRVYIYGIRVNTLLLRKKPVIVHRASCGTKLVSHLIWKYRHYIYTDGGQDGQVVSFLTIIRKIYNRYTYVQMYNTCQIIQGLQGSQWHSLSSYSNSISKKKC